MGMLPIGDTSGSVPFYVNFATGDSTQLRESLFLTVQVVWYRLPTYECNPAA